MVGLATKTKTIALFFFVVHCLLILFICAIWYRYNRNLSEYGGEMADGIFGIVLLLSTIYYFSFTVWTYKVYKSKSLKTAGLQLGLIFVFSILTAVILLFKMYY